MAAVLPLSPLPASKCCWFDGTLRARRVGLPGPLAVVAVVFLPVQQLRILAGRQKRRKKRIVRAETLPLLSHPSGEISSLPTPVLWLRRPLKRHGWYIAQNNEKLRLLEAQNLANFTHPDIVVSRIEAILAFDRVAELPRIKTPTLVVGAADDNVTPAYFSEELARLIPGAELKLFPRGGHSFTQVLCREFNMAVLPFLEAHTPQAERR